jgi:hypothetical protein
MLKSMNKYLKFNINKIRYMEEESKTTDVPETVE